MAHRFVQFGFSAAIAATFVALVAVGINVFVPHPDFQAGDRACGGYSEPRPVTSETLTPEEREAERQKEFEQRICYDRIQAERRTFNQKVFAFAIPIGVLGVAFGVLIFPKLLPMAASGMTFGGLLTILYGTIRGVGAVDQRLIFLVALAAFVGLLVVAWKQSRTVLSAIRSS